MTIQVLFVDDEVALLPVAKEFLEDSGSLSVSVARSGEEALEFLQNNTVSAIIADYHMPGMSGIELLQHVREKYGQLPFILFTGKGEESVVIEALNNGADYYIKKGDDPNQTFSAIEERIKKAVRRFETQDEIASSQKIYETIQSVKKDFILRLTPDMSIVTANDEYAATAGIPVDELRGTDFSEQFRPADQERLANCIAALTPDHTTEAVEVQKISSDNTSQWQRWTLQATFESDNELSGILAVGKDITGIKDAEENLRRQEEQYVEQGGDLPVTGKEDDENVTLNFLIENTPATGSFSFSDLLPYAKKEGLSGIAAARTLEGNRSYLIFAAGEPGGSIYIDQNGSLFGDNSLFFIQKSGSFSFHPIKDDVAKRLITGCRIFDHTHLHRRSATIIPDIGTSSRKGLGNLTITIKQNGSPSPKTRVTIKKEGKIISNDMTSPAGEVRFSLHFGEYEAVIHSSGQMIKTDPFTFDENHTTKTFDIGGL